MIFSTNEKEKQSPSILPSIVHFPLPVMANRSAAGWAYSPALLSYNVEQPEKRTWLKHCLPKRNRASCPSAETQ